MSKSKSDSPVTVDIIGWKVIIQYQRYGYSSSNHQFKVFVKDLMKIFINKAGNASIDTLSFNKLYYTGRIDQDYADEYYMYIYENSIKYTYGSGLYVIY